MYTDMRHYMVRQEQNRALLQEAAFERWMSKIAPQQIEKEPLLDQVVHWFGDWFTREQASFCSGAEPACGLGVAA